MYYFWRTHKAADLCKQQWENTPLLFIPKTVDIIIALFSLPSSPSPSPPPQAVDNNVQIVSYARIVLPFYIRIVWSSEYDEYRKNNILRRTVYS